MQNVSFEILVVGRIVKQFNPIFPFAGVVSNNKNFDNIQQNGLGGTYNGNALCSAAANATLDVFNRHDLIANASFIGEYITHKLGRMNHCKIREVRQYGLMIAIELDIDDSTFRQLMSSAPDYGILLLSTGITPTIRLLPPLTITTCEVDFFVDKLQLLLDST